MDAKNIISDIEEIGNAVKKRTNAYFYDGDFTEIIDSNLNAKIKLLLKVLKELKLIDYYEAIGNELYPIQHNAIQCITYIDSIKEEIIECSKWSNPKERLLLINRIAYLFQEKYSISEINILLKSVGISNIDNSVPSSKRVYLQEILMEEPVNRIIKLAKSEKLFESLIEIDETSVISNSNLEEQIDKCLEKVNNGDYDGSITNARTMVEELLLSLEEKITGFRQNNEGDLNQLYKRVRKLLNLEPNNPQINNSLNEILRGFVNIISGISGMSNNSGDRHATIYKPEKRHALLIVNSCLMLCKFLISTYEYQYLN